MDASLDGLRRARARQAPIGYEGQSRWQGEYGAAEGPALMALYRQRQQDRIDAENAERSMRQQQTGLWEPSVQNSANMGGFFEGVQHNDQAAGIDPDTGAVVEGPKSVRMVAPTMSAYQQGTERLRRGGIENNSTYALMALRRALQEGQ